MDVLKCRALVRAVDTGSFSAAAAELGYTPSGVIRMVNALEGELGFPLLHRSRRGVQPTEEGRRMLPVLRELVGWDRQAGEAAAEIRGLTVGSVRIGAYYSVAAYWLPEVIRAFQSDYPGIRIHTQEGGNSELALQLEQRQVDCCFFSEYPLRCDWIPLRKDQLVAWLPQDHPLAALDAFPLSALDGAPFIQQLPGCETDTERLLEAEGLRPDVRFTTVDSYTTYAMVEAGLGVAVNNRLMSRSWNGRVAVRPFDPPRFITLGIAVPSLKDASPAVKTFIGYARRILGEE